MSLTDPGPRAMQHCREVLRALSSTRQVYTLYSAGHPNRADALTTLLDATRQLLSASGAPPVIFMTRNSFYLGATLLARESLSLYRLVEAFEQHRIHAVEPLPGVDEDDLDGLVRMLLGELPVSHQLDHLAVNRLALDMIEDDTQTSDDELRRSYGKGLEVLRDAAVRAAAGRPVDLTATNDVVDELSTRVARDPSQALLLTTVKSYDEYTYYHMMNVCLLSIALGHAIKLRKDQVVALGIGALLHDVGKMAVPPEILTHVGPLTSEQWRMVQRHPVEGAGLVFGTREGLYHPAATVVLEHHAAYDLSGYPDLSHRPLPSPPARLVAVADCFDAVTSKRSYRRAEERRQALNILIAGAGRGFDPRLVRIFVRLLGVYPIGSLVRLTTGETGMVVRNHGALLDRPTVRVVLDASGTPCDPEELDTAEQGRYGDFLRGVEASLDPEEMGIDMTTLAASGRVEAAEVAGESGLVHEPSYGESAPPGYVDTHNEPEAGHGHGHGHEHDVEMDPDVAPPIELDGEAG